MLKIQEIRELIKLIDQSNIDEFKFEQNGSKITMRKQANAAGNKQQVVSEGRTAAVSQPVIQETAPIQQEPAAEAVQQPAAAANTERSENMIVITSPMVGTFYQAPSPEASPYVNVGDKVSPETVVCIVEAMKLMNEIEAEINGEIVEVLAENGELVEYGQELFLVKKG
ncbi:acetyl-CoA carboxylase biotin carboxyl carrier protein [Evansella caseinilytica]|uniref:Biotin carboxyl carrier protein of acetyl-CoA carboxylase n=1 Tax=Evansella caseinilytica TaxID=1503961 RepID=A0A1H3KW69_9BACI|nr:acetyl-CoA carboxylase biotin carboxyl carrier protein [Evansella caseinilytica]SDY56423.1 acetyl-CoA carboxylase biotin carboxyl carrier protein [Evansella caseinilytica]